MQEGFNLESADTYARILLGSQCQRMITITVAIFTQLNFLWHCLKTIVVTSSIRIFGTSEPMAYYTPLTVCSWELKHIVKRIALQHKVFRSQ